MIQPAQKRQIIILSLSWTKVITKVIRQRSASANIRSAAAHRWYLPCGKDEGSHAPQCLCIRYISNFDCNEIVCDALVCPLPNRYKQSQDLF